MKIKVGNIVQLRKTKELREEYRGAILKVTKLKSAGEYHAGRANGAGFDTLFHPNDILKVVKS